MIIKGKLFKALEYPYKPLKNQYSVDLCNNLYYAFYSYSGHYQLLTKVVTKHFIEKFISDNFKDTLNWTIKDFRFPDIWQIKLINAEYKINLSLEVGIPDFFIGNTKTKEYFFIEVKINSDSLRQSQIKWINNSEDVVYILHISCEKELNNSILEKEVNVK